MWGLRVAGALLFVGILSLGGAASALSETNLLDGRTRKIVLDRDVSITLIGPGSPVAVSTYNLGSTVSFFPTDVILPPTTAVDAPAVSMALDMNEDLIQCPGGPANCFQIDGIGLSPDLPSTAMRAPAIDIGLGQFWTFEFLPSVLTGMGSSFQACIDFTSSCQVFANVQPGLTDVVTDMNGQLAAAHITTDPFTIRATLRTDSGILGQVNIPMFLTTRTLNLDFANNCSIGLAGSFDPTTGNIVLEGGGCTSTTGPFAISLTGVMVPEPTTAVLLGLGLIGLVISGNRYSRA
jgi:hypothetical protein